MLLGSAAWQSICDPMFAAVGVDPRKITYVEAGWPTWTTALAGGQGNACLAWEGLRATSARRVSISTTGWACADRPCRQTRWWCGGPIWPIPTGSPS